MSNYLNDYHMQFLSLFLKYGARFIIIGGQARSFYSGLPTSDLDVWIDASPDNTLIVVKCIIDWLVKHPLHIMPGTAVPPQLPINFHIKIPDEVAAYMDSGGNPTEITPQTGIDILTSIMAHDFETFYSRANYVLVSSLRLPLLAEADVKVISPPP